MSGTEAQTQPPIPVSTEWKTAAGIVSIYSLTLLLAGLGITCYLRMDNAITMIIGAIVGNAGTVVNFYMGSSRSSQSKDATIASQLPPSKTPTPGSTTTTVVAEPAKSTTTTVEQPGTTTP